MQLSGASTAGKGTAPSAAKPITFRRSAFEHAELVGQQSVQMGGSAVPFNQIIQVPAYGFLRGLWFVLTGTGATPGDDPPTATLDGIFAALSLTFQDVSGNPFYGPMPAGFFISAVQKYGGYRFAFDPRAISTPLDADGNFTAYFYVPVEMIKRSGLGSITNLNAAASYQIYASLSPSSLVYATNPPSPLPVCTLQVYQDCWSQPPAQDILGNLTTRQPPSLNTTQFNTLQSYPIAGAGYQSVKLLRVGYYIRNLIGYIVDTTGARSDTPTPPVLELWKDNQQLWIQPTSLLRVKTYTDFGYGLTPADLDEAGYQDTGIYPIVFDNDFGLEPGNELRNGYLPTLQSTKLELRGNFQAACTLYVITNDIAPPEGLPGSIFCPTTL